MFSLLFLIHLNTYLVGLRPLEILIILSGDRLYKSESDVDRRQILTYKDGHRTERVYPTITPLVVLNLFY